MAAWILGGCGANNGAPAFFQCQPTDPYANVEIPDLLTTLSVPRIKYVVCSDDRRRQQRLYDQYGDEIIVDDALSVTSSTALPSPHGMVYTHRHNSKGSRSRDLVINVRRCHSRSDHPGGDNEHQMELGPDGVMRQKAGSRAQNATYDPSQGTGDEFFGSARYDRNGNLLPPPISPIAEDQVSARSSERIRSLQALLGGSALTDRHGKPPPLSAPYYQSGALHEAEDDLQPIALSTPQMTREAAWVH